MAWCKNPNCEYKDWQQVTHDQMCQDGENEMFQSSGTNLGIAKKFLRSFDKDGDDNLDNDELRTLGDWLVDIHGRG